MRYLKLNFQLIEYQNVHTIWTYWLIKTLISAGTSWTRRNLLMQRLHHKDQQQSQQQLQNNRQKCIEDNDQLVASPWFQEGLSRYVQQLHCLKKSCSLKPQLKKIWVHFKVARLRCLGWICWDLSTSFKETYNALKVTSLKMHILSVDHFQSSKLVRCSK